VNKTAVKYPDKTVTFSRSKENRFMHLYWLCVMCASLVISLICSICPAKAQSGIVAATPPMGWSSWNHFADKVTEADVRAAADAMVASGMRDAGYIYVNIDEG
jgi:hypothetical protein